MFKGNKKSGGLVSYLGAPAVSVFRELWGFYVPELGAEKPVSELGAARSQAHVHSNTVGMDGNLVKPHVRSQHLCGRSGVGQAHEGNQIEEAEMHRAWFFLFLSSLPSTEHP